jgi:hypothetical protein
VAPLGWNSALWQRYDPDYGRQVITPCSKLMVHHTASNVPTAGDEADFTRQLEAYGESRDGAAVEYHYLIYPTGVCHGGFGDTRGCHSAQTDPSAGVNYNETAIGVSFVGYFHPPNNDQPTAAAVATFRAWLEWMVDSQRLAPEVVEQAPWNGAAGWYGHRDVFATACPGDVLYPQLGDIIALPGPGAPAPDTYEEEARMAATYTVNYGTDAGLPDGAVYELVHGTKRLVGSDEWYQVLKGVMADRAGVVAAHDPWTPVAYIANGWYLAGLPDYAP